MNRIQQLFQNKQQNVLNVYCTAGYPTLESTVEVMQALQNNGADLIELGMPYSDPLADGPVIQASSSVALNNGMTMEVLFQQLKSFRSNNSPSWDRGITVPVILMGYMNPVLQFGFEKFCQYAADCPIDGIILPDLPEYEFENEYREILQRYGLNFIFLVTPETSEERVRKLDSLSTGFLYAVSSSATTGSNTDFDAVEKYLQRLQSYQLQNPILVGFGIKDKTTFESACKYANGAIIGSAYIKALEGTNDVEETTKQFLSTIIK
ncbi:MAG: tryptophan synthase subunit alpha [Chitinophagaceae bacterium]|nr:tryptophan synthase subunit alpha [Chitinophagaceae bacterium]